MATRKTAPPTRPVAIRRKVSTSALLPGAGALLADQSEVPADAVVVLGRSANGRIEWKDAQGRTLKELQEHEAAIG